MKQFFRFLRGELNGFYITSLNNMFIRTVSRINSFLNTYSRMQWINDEQITQSEVPIPNEQMRGICTIAGVFPPYAEQDSLLGSIRLTQSHKVSNEEYSDRGLLNIASESFDFYRTDDKEYSTDINTLASTLNRTSMIDAGAELLGFFCEGDNILNSDGSINTAFLYHFDGTIEEQYAAAADFFTKKNKAYSPYYGNKYLYLSESSPVLALTNNNILVELLKAEQYVRKNGQSIKSLAMFANILCPSFLFITRIEWSVTQPYAIVYYGIDELYEVNDKLLCVDVFKIVSSTKFKQFIFLEVTIQVERDYSGKPINVKEVTE